MPNRVSPRVEIVVPVKDEERDLERSVRRLRTALDGSFPFETTICIADNGSADGTWDVASKLAAELPGVRAVHLELPGRGRALRHVWSESDADIVAYLDVDLSTDLNALLPLIAPLASGHSDIAIGTRLARGSRVVRGPKREFISRCYNLLLRATLRARFSDAQCGFKAMRADVARSLLPLVADDGWFFDTELLVLAERAHLRIHEVPVDWIDDPDSRVTIVRTALDDLKGMLRVGSDLLRRRLPLDDIRLAHGREDLSNLFGTAPRLLRFAGVGVLSTIAYALVYLLLRQLVPPQTANVLALLVTAIGNTAANRRVTWRVRGRRDRVRHQVRGLVTFGIGWSLTAASLWLLDAAVPAPARWVEITVLTAANLAATIVRFSLFQTWVFGSAAVVEPRTSARPDTYLGAFTVTGEPTLNRALDRTGSER